MEIEFVSRYDVFGPSNGCKGRCEGTSFIPVKENHSNILFRFEWYLAEARYATDDGWHFIPCPECHQEGKKAKEWLLRLHEVRDEG